MEAHFRATLEVGVVDCADALHTDASGGVRAAVFRDICEEYARAHLDIAHRHAGSRKRYCRFRRVGAIDGEHGRGGRLVRNLGDVVKGRLMLGVISVVAARDGQDACGDK